MLPGRRACAVCLAFLAASLFLTAADPFRYQEKEHGPARLRYVNGLPVLTVEGTPEEIGGQIAAITAGQTERLFRYPRDILRAHGFSAAWPILLQTGKRMEPQFPEDYRREIAAMAAAGLDRDLLIMANTMFDVKKLVGCSSLIVDKDRSQGGGPFLGRNLDFPTCGYLQEFSLVIVYRPKGKRPFVSIGFPGMVGVLSGINDAGLAVAVHEVYASRDGSPRFDPAGIPYAMCFRRILEECATVADAQKLLASLPRTTMLDLAICDRRGGGVLEVTTKQVVFRQGTDGICACTNHFLAPEVKLDRPENLYLTLDRYQALEEARARPRLGLSEIQATLHAANLGEHTLQTMVFEPAALRLHLAIGACPSSALKLQTLDLGPVLGR